MNHVRQMTRLAGSTAWRFVVLTPLIMLVAVGVCALWLGWLAWVAGLPPAEFAFGFVQEVAVPVSGATAQLSIIALCFATVACFGRWCQSQAKLHHDAPLLSRVPRFVSTNTILNFLANSVSRIFLSSFTNRLLLYARNRALASTPAGLAGASPLLL